MPFTLKIKWTRPDSSIENFEISKTITWTGIETPIIDLMKPSYYLVTKENKFGVIFKTNYQTAESRVPLEITWTLQPDAQNTILSDDKLNFTIPAGGLKPETDYAI